MKRDILLVVVLILSIIAFMGGATYAVINGGNERENLAKTSAERDKVICTAVTGLRTDLVEVINSQKGRGIKNARKLGLDVKQIKKDYKEMTDKIGDRKCP